jgi:hypothetical protein
LVVLSVWTDRSERKGLFMGIQYESFPDGNDGLPLDKQLEELGEQLGFFVEGSTCSLDSDQAPRSDEHMTLKVAVIFHKSDAKSWQRLSRHLELLEVPRWRIEWFSLRLFPEIGDLFEERTRTQLTQMHLVLLIVSIDLVEVLVKRCPALYKTLADPGEETVVLPILLRPVFWSCSFPTLEPVPRRAISLWGNQDAAHVTVAKKFSGVLRGIQTFLESDAGDTTDGGEAGK